MSAEQNKEVARRVFQAFNERRLEGLEGAVFNSALVYRHHGQESDLRHWQQDARNCIASFPDVQLTIESEQVNGDHITVNYRLKGMHFGLAGGTRPSGKSIEVAGKSVFRVMNGLIVEVDDYVDEEALAGQLALA